MIAINHSIKYTHLVKLTHDDVPVFGYLLIIYKVTSINVMAFSTNSSLSLSFPSSSPSSFSSSTSLPFVIRLPFFLFLLYFILPLASLLLFVLLRLFFFKFFFCDLLHHPFLLLIASIVQPLAKKNSIEYSIGLLLIVFYRIFANSFL